MDYITKNYVLEFKEAMHCICYCYETVQVLNDNIMFIHEISH